MEKTGEYTASSPDSMDNETLERMSDELANEAKMLPAEKRAAFITYMGSQQDNILLGSMVKTKLANSE